MPCAMAVGTIIGAKEAAQSAQNPHKMAAENKTPPPAGRGCFVFQWITGRSIVRRVTRRSRLPFTQRQWIVYNEAINEAIRVWVGPRLLQARAAGMQIVGYQAD